MKENEIEAKSIAFNSDMKRMAESKEEE